MVTCVARREIIVEVRLHISRSIGTVNLVEEPCYCLSVGVVPVFLSVILRPTLEVVVLAPVIVGRHHSQDVVGRKVLDFSLLFYRTYI